MYDVKGTNFIAMDQDEYLEHFGTKGMHWGHRKSGVNSGVSKASLENSKYDMLDKRSKSKNSDSELASYRESAASYHNLKRKRKGREALDSDIAAEKQDSINKIAKAGKVALIAYGTYRVANLIGTTIVDMNKKY